jgi:hypothetical protein
MLHDFPVQARGDEELRAGIERHIRLSGRGDRTGHAHDLGYMSGDPADRLLGRRRSKRDFDDPDVTFYKRFGKGNGLVRVGYLDDRHEPHPQELVEDVAIPLRPPHLALSKIFGTEASVGSAHASFGTRAYQPGRPGSRSYG